MPGQRSSIPGKSGSVGGISNNSASAENDSDSGRPRSTDFEEDAKESTTRTTTESGRTEMDSDDDYPELNGELSGADSIESPPPSRESKVSVHSEAATSVAEQKMARKERAAVTIQAYTRGHLTRKKLKRPQTPGPFPREMEEEDLDYSEPEQSEHFTEPEDNEIEEPEQGEAADEPITREEAAVTIQKHWRGYEVRKNLPEKQPETPVNLEEGLIDTDDENELHETLESGMSREVDKEESPDGPMTYMVRIFTGNRWAADTEADLHIVLHGEDGDSEKRILQQDSQNPRFVQGQVDDFLLVMPSVGKLRKITIGHDHRGYGAGLFIDQVIIVEGSGNGRVYLFQCYKWFDSGQVDGKLERVLNCTATYQGPLNGLKKSQGRWELLLHNGQASTGLGATTSNLNLFGYSHDVMAKSIDIYDNTLAQVPSVSLIQVDFGAELANLTKVRVEIDGSGDMPDYYLDYVELNDLDTDEKIEVTMAKWLRWNSEDKGAQAFRELVVFKGTPDALPLCTYEGKLRVLVNKIALCHPNVKVELFGENGESGIFPVSLENKDGKKDKFDVSFRIEAASLGRNIGIRIYFDPTEQGAAIYDGLGEVQRIFDKLGVENAVGDGCFIIQHGLIRESTHTPYRMVLEQSRIVPRVDESDSFVLELRTTRMEGLSTKISKSKMPKKKTPNWIVSMLIDERSTLLPAVTLCGADGSEQMQCLDTTPVDGLISYQQKSDNIGEIKKIRISIDRGQRLNVLPDEEMPKPRVLIKKIRVNDGANGDIIHFPAATAEFFEYSVVEYPAIWPDVQPIESVYYEITVSTEDSRTQMPFRAHFKIIGEMGDTGLRYFGVPDGSTPTIFEPGSQKSVQFEALNIGEIQTIEAHVEANEEFFWKISEVVVHSEDGLFYVFHFDKPFTLKQNRQICHVSPLTALL
uniref:PLAT domain-containing protein n=1 Tax=Panagrolaimus sp. JU765 TaxID=591449 RepID=A0AC34PV50_9BILA